MRCSECGAEGSGNFCARCGAPLGEEGSPRCPDCGAELEEDAYFCSGCGEPVRERPRKSFRDQLPWVLSGLALIAFAVGITLFIQNQTSPRRPGDPPTGGVVSGGSQQMSGVDPSETGLGGSSAGGGADGAMPTAEELEKMSPREAADRLFNRTMRMQAAGSSPDRVPFFARMGVRAYRRLPPEQVNADVRFHVGLLQLARGETAAARAEADTILSGEEDNLLGLLLASRAAEAAGDSALARRYRRRLRTELDRVDLQSRPSYAAHSQLLRSAAGS